MRQGWEEKTLKEITTHLGDGLHGTPKYTIDGDYYFVNGNNLIDGKIVFKENTKKVSIDQYEKYQKNLTDRSILVSINGTLGNVAFYNNEKIILGKSACYFNINDKVDKNFIKYNLSSSIFLNYANKEATGATIKNVSLKSMREYKINIPSLQEQQSIVTILDEVFATIDKAKANTEQNLKNTKELFEYHLHKYFTNKEKGWEEKKLKDVAEYFNGLTYSPKDVSDTGIIVLRSSNIQNDKLDFKDIVRVNLNVKDKIKVIDGDILMCSRNGSQRLVGKTAKIQSFNEVMTFGTFMMIIRSEYNPYLSWFFKSSDFKKQISGGENTMINQVTRYMLDDIILSFPKIDKQNDIVFKLDALYEQTKKLETVYKKKLQDLEELKKSVLQKAFSGELTSKSV
ncbi:MAG: restriction endonuclease subunit S [Bacteroidota bacterium]